YHKGKWSPKHVSDAFLSTKQLLVPGHSDADNYACKAITEGDDVVVRVILPAKINVDKNGNEGGEFETSTALTFVGEFRFAGALTNVPSVRPGGEVMPSTTATFTQDNDYSLIIPADSGMHGNAFLERASVEPQTHGLTLYDYQYLNQLFVPPIDESIVDAVDHIKVTTKTPVSPKAGTLLFTIVPPHNE